MSRVLPFPLLSLFLWATWMLLNGFSWGHALLGLVLAVVLHAVFGSACEERNGRAKRKTETEGSRSGTATR